jgi:hypothetical protein
MTTLTIPTITKTVLTTISAVTTTSITKTITQNITTTIISEGESVLAIDLQQILGFLFSIITTIIIEGAICICIKKRAIKDSRKNLPMMQQDLDNRDDRIPNPSQGITQQDLNNRFDRVPNPLRGLFG